MPITLLDIILIGVMMISALLAMIRGFMREVLSIAAWLIAALVTLYSFSKLLPVAKTYFNNDIVAYAIVIGGTFLGTLLVVSVITVRFSDMVLDSRVGALDRTMGFVFGLARGLVIVSSPSCSSPGSSPTAASRSGCAAPSRGWSCRELVTGSCRCCRKTSTPPSQRG